MSEQGRGNYAETCVNRGLRSVVSVLVAFIFLFAQFQSALAAIDNTAQAVGQYNGAGITSIPASASVPVIPANPLIEVNKSGILNDDDGTPGLSAGDTISYTIVVTNPGNISLTGVSVSDPLITTTFQGGDTDNDFRLDPTETWTYTGSYTLTPSDISTSGGGDDDIDNIVTVTSNESPPDSDSQETTIDPDISMLVTKTGTLNDDDGTSGLSAGDTISYDITVENNGLVDLSTVIVTDSLDQSGNITNLSPSFDSGDVNNDSTLNSGEVWLYTANYTLTQDDIDDGGNIVNTATVTTDQIGPRTGLDTLILAGFVDSFTMTKLANLVDGDADNLADVGEIINYTFRFTNTGNRTLTNLLPSDPLPGLSAITCSNDGDVDGDIDTLTPGQTLDCTASYTVQPADILAGSVDNTATSSATRINGVVPVAEDDTANDNSTMTPTDSNFELDVDKTVVSAVEILPNVVEIDFLIEVTNLASATQSNITAQDDVVGAISAPATLIGDASIVSIAGFSGPGIQNAGYNGSSDTELLSGDVQLAPLATGQITIRAQIDRRAQDLAISNTAFVSSDQVSGNVPSDDPNETPGDPNDVNPTPFASPDQDGDGSPDSDEPSTGDRDGDSVTDDADYDPTGYFYCEEDGRILPGGFITVTNLSAGGSQAGVGSSNDITILQDGSGGFYQFYVTAPGAYRLDVTLPPSGVASTAHTSSGSLDATTLLPSNPGVLGAGEFGATGVLSNFSAAANPFFTEFVIENGDPTIFNNNIPLALCSTPTVLASKDIAVAPVIEVDGTSTLTYRVSAENNSATRIDDVSLSDDLNAVFGAGLFTVVSHSIETAPALFGANIDPFYNGAGNTNLLTTGGSLEAGESVSVLIEVNVDVIAGNYTNTVLAGGVHPLTAAALPTDDASVSVTILSGAATSGVVATKTTPVASAPLGGIVPYTITFENRNALPVAGAEFIDMLPLGFTYVPGSATIDGTPVEPVVENWNLVWAGQNIPGNTTVTVQLQLIVGAGVTGTEFTNTAWVSNPLDNSLISNRARATIRLEVESVFQCSQVIGRVFDDLDKDGYHDVGEPGLAGVRLASVKGLLITTDEHGRYHVACDSIPDDRIGSNYILKLDTRTLPTGYRITSENPRVVRLTRGKLVKLNFAASNLRTISLALGNTSFRAGSTSLAPNSLREVARILPLLEEEPSVLRISFRDDVHESQLQKRRLKAVKALVERAWASRARPHKLVIEVGNGPVVN